MKKFLIPFISLVLIIIIIAVITWFNIPSIVAHMLSKEFNVPVSVGNVDILKNNVKIKDLNIGTPKDSKTNSSFFTKEIDLKTTLKNIKRTGIIIDSFTLNNNIIGIEFYNKSGSDNNWKRMMQTPSKSKKSSDRKYLIKKLTLNKISVVLTKQNGQKQNFPTIEKLEFYNISDETGFPIDELEKAIAQAVLKSVFQKFNLLNLINDIPPVKVIEKAIPIFKK